MTKQDFVTKQDELFHHLSYMADLFKKEGIDFQISDGTLLGAVRENDILATEERDFDIDIADTEVEKVREVAKMARQDGYDIVERKPRVVEFDTGYDIWNMKAERTPTGGAGFLIKHQGEFVGDIYIYTVFNDGLARRYCLESEASPNAKMTIPAWLLEDSKPVYIRGKEFPGSRAPEKLLTKTYGDDWETPIAPGEFGPGRNPDSGGIYDSDLEHLVIHALGNGWDPKYGDKPVWSRRISKIGSYAGRRWVMHHDPFYMIEDPDLFSEEEADTLKKRIDLGPSEAVRVLLLTVIAARLKMKKRDISNELKAAREEASQAIARAVDAENDTKAMSGQQATLEKQMLAELNAAHRKYGELKQRRSVRAALKIANAVYSIRQRLSQLFR